MQSAFKILWGDTLILFWVPLQTIIRTQTHTIWIPAPHCSCSAELRWSSFTGVQTSGGRWQCILWVGPCFSDLCCWQGKKKWITVQSIIQYPSVPRASGNKLSLHTNYGESQCLTKRSPQLVGNKPVSLRTNVTVINSISEYAKDKTSWH